MVDKADIKMEKILAERKIAKALTEFHAACGAIPVDFSFEMIDVSTLEDRVNGIKRVVIGQHNLRAEI